MLPRFADARSNWDFPGRHITPFGWRCFTDTQVGTNGPGGLDAFAQGRPV
jgi:hypothetical protein